MKFVYDDFLRDAQWLKPLVGEVDHQPLITKFETKFVSFGSCFAQNMQGILWQYLQDAFFDHEICAHYSSKTALDSISMLAENKKYSAEDLFYYQNDQKDVGSYRHHKIKSYGENAVEDCLKKIKVSGERLRSKLLAADVITLTLGTTVYATYKKTNHPICCFNGLEQENATLHTMESEEVVSDLHAFYHALLKIRSEKPFKFIVTVSPQRYPWDKKVTGLPFVQYNNLSKASLIVAAHRFVKECKGKTAIYFPSYEMVIDELRLYETLSTYDHMHVNQPLTPKYVVKRFLNSFSTPDFIKALPLVDSVVDLCEYTRLRLENGDNILSPAILKNWDKVVTLINDLDESLNPQKLIDYTKVKLLRLDNGEQLFNKLFKVI